MKALLVLVAVFGWYALGVVGAGFVAAQFVQRDSEFPHWSVTEREQKRRELIGFCLIWSIFGPFALVFGFLFSGFGQYGWWHTALRGEEGRTR